MFNGGPYLLRVIVASILFALSAMAVVGLSAVPGGLLWVSMGRDAMAGPVALALGLFVGFVAWVVLALRFSQFYYLIIGRDAEIIDSFRISYEVTRGKAAMIFVIGLLSFAINIAGALACFVGLIFTIPYTMLLFVVTYLALTGQPTADPFGPDEPLAELEPL